MFFRKGIATLLVLFSFLLASCSGPAAAPDVNDLLDLGEKYLLELNYEEAIVQFTKVIEIDPNHAGAYTGRGDAYVKLAESGGERSAEYYANAVSDYNKALEIDNQAMEIYIKLADTYLILGDTESAIALLEKGYEITQNEELRNKLQTLQGTELAADSSLQESETTIESVDPLNGDNYSIEIVDEKNAVITIFDSSLETHYLINNSSSEQDSLEYRWQISFGNADNEYRVSVAAWASNPGEEELKSINEFQSSLWKRTETGGASRLYNIENEIGNDYIRWHVEIPAEEPFSFYEIETAASDIVKK